jgi:hypothetical protein
MVIEKTGPSRTVWVGFDPRESDGFAVTKSSIVRRLTQPIAVHGLVLSSLRARGLYTRPTDRRDGRLFDVISNAPMATEFALSRFLIKELAGSGWALFMDSDMLVRANLARLFDILDPSKAVMCVKHDHRPAEGTKMDGQVQTSYPRKNWSSVFALNCDHPANKALTLDLVNSERGLRLHQFCWLEDDDIGELGVQWNWLVGHSPADVDPAIVHFTEGIPSMPGYADCPFADEWRAELYRWAA